MAADDQQRTYSEVGSDLGRCGLLRVYKEELRVYKEEKKRSTPSTGGTCYPITSATPIVDRIALSRDSDEPHPMARVSTCGALTFDSIHNRLYMADPAFHCIRRFDLVDDIATALELRKIKALNEFPPGLLPILLGYLGYTNVSTVAGNGKHGTSGDGMAYTVSFSTPSAVCVDQSGDIVISDTGNHRICKLIVDNDFVTTVAGSLGPGYEDDRGSRAGFDMPGSVVVDSTGRILVSDTGNQRIRIIHPQTGLIESLVASWDFLLTQRFVSMLINCDAVRCGLVAALVYRSIFRRSTGH